MLYENEMMFNVASNVSGPISCGIKLFKKKKNIYLIISLNNYVNVVINHGPCYVYHLIGRYIIIIITQYNIDSYLPNYCVTEWLENMRKLTTTAQRSQFSVQSRLRPFKRDLSAAERYWEAKLCNIVIIDGRLDQILRCYIINVNNKCCVSIYAWRVFQWGEGALGFDRVFSDYSRIHGLLTVFYIPIKSNSYLIIMKNGSYVIHNRTINGSLFDVRNYGDDGGGGQQIEIRPLRPFDV
jgi:hypothetical protein